jgi:hypothetical protein
LKRRRAGTAGFFRIAYGDRGTDSAMWVRTPRTAAVALVPDRAYELWHIWQTSAGVRLMVT